MPRKPKETLPKASKPAPHKATRLVQAGAAETPKVVSFATGGELPSRPRRHLSVIDVDAGPDDRDEVAQTALAKREYDGLVGPHRSESRAFQLALSSSPYNYTSKHLGLYRTKTVGIPDAILKRIPSQDSLVGSIVTARQSQAQQHGVPREDRFSVGFYFDWNDKKWFHSLPQADRRMLDQEVRAVTAKMLTCGETDGWGSEDRRSLSSWLRNVTRSAMTVGRVATERVWRCEQCESFEDCDCGAPRQFHSFRAVDAGTILPTIRNQAEGIAESIRERSQALLRDMTGKEELEVPIGTWDRYAFVQVVDGREVQVFTDDQMCVRNLYEVPDVEWQGFPCTPLDTVVTEVLTHISIGRHNQLYFQNGRAARGMIIITSDEVDQDMLMQMRQQFMAGVNGVQHAHRMPIFGVAPGDGVQWVPMDNSSRDMEYQYLSDNNVRAILSAYQMSPEELPGYAHLSRGTASQSLAESSQEYLLEAHRDLGIRPFLADLEAYINEDIFRYLAPRLAKLCRFRFGGLKAQTRDQEDAMLERYLSIDGTLNEALTLREKETLPAELGGNIPLNPGWGQLLQSYVPVGTIMESLFQNKGATQDPRFAYVRDPFYWQNRDAAMEQLQMVLQPPMVALAPLVLPGILRVAFPALPDEQLGPAAQALLAAVQQQIVQEQQLAVQQAAQGEPLGDKNQEPEPAEKSEHRVRKSVARQRRFVDDCLRDFSKNLQGATKKLLLERKT